MRSMSFYVGIAVTLTLPSLALAQNSGGTTAQNPSGNSGSSQPYYSPFTDPNSSVNLPFRSSVPVQNSNGKSVSGTFTWNPAYVNSQRPSFAGGQSGRTSPNGMNGTGQFSVTPQLLAQVSMLFDVDGDQQLAIGELSNMAILLYGEEINALASRGTRNNLAAAQGSMRGKGLQQMQMLVQFFILQALEFDVDQNLMLNQAELLMMYSRMLYGSSAANSGMTLGLVNSTMIFPVINGRSGMPNSGSRYSSGNMSSAGSGRQYGTGVLRSSVPSSSGNSQRFGGVQRPSGTSLRSTAPNNFDTSLRRPGL